MPDPLVRAPFAVAFLDGEGCFREANASFQATTVDYGSLKRGDPVQKLFPEVGVERWHRLHTIADAESQVSFSALMMGDGPEQRRVELTLQRSESHVSATYLLYLRDIETQQQAESLLTLQREVLEAVATGCPLREVMNLLCLRVEELEPDILCTVLRVDEEGLLHPFGANAAPEAYNAALDGVAIGPAVGSCGTAAWRGESVEVSDIATDPLWADYKDLALAHGLRACWSVPIKLKDGRTAGTFALYYREPRFPSAYHREMVHTCSHLCSLAFEHEANLKQVHELVFYDTLTGLANRSLLLERAQELLRQSQERGKPLAVMFLDIDNFKTVNDSLGHHQGDHLLQEITIRLQAILRPVDMLARFGGDEFVVLMPDLDEESVRAVAERLLMTLSRTISLEGSELLPTASVGITLAPQDGVDFDSLQSNADLAMHQAKLAGKNTYRFFQHQMNEAVVRRLEMETALRRALQEGGLTVHYQPQVYLDGQQVHGMEALVRWEHPEWGMISPGSFIPLAEECGLISEIDRFVLDTACAQMRSWREQGLEVPAVSVNLSVADLHEADYVENVRATLERHDVPPEWLALEITESLMMESSEKNLEVLNRLRGIGLTLSVDDFGTGYSSLSYLKRFPVQELKLDFSFVRHLADDANDRALADVIIHLGQTFNLVVVAEGVETQEQLRILREKGCQVAQGFLFARPMPAEDVTRWLRLRSQVA